MHLLTQIALCMIVSLLFVTPCEARQSIEQIRYELFKNPQAHVIPDLQYLVERGNAEAMHLLASRISNDLIPKRHEAIELYIRSFDEGRGYIPSLGSLAVVMEQFPFHKESYAAFFEQSLMQYSHARDPDTVKSTLNVFLTYPELFETSDVDELIKLHQRGCLNDCSPSLYKAVLAEHLGQIDIANTWFRLAMYEDERAVERYYIFLGPDRNKTFPAFAREIFARIVDVPPIVATQIGRQLDRISDLRKTEEEIEKLTEAESNILSDAADDAIAEPESTLIRSEAYKWISYAAREKWLPAQISLFNFMTSSPMSFTGQEALELIDEINKSDPVKATSLLASALMVTDWSTLDPARAHQIIEQMLKIQHPDALYLLASLYSRGGLDEPDQEAALSIYKRIAAQGSITAYYRKALIYAYGRGICHDYPRALAYARIASDLGTNRVGHIILYLTQKLSDDDFAEVNEIYHRVIGELNL